MHHTMRWPRCDFIVELPFCMIYDTNDSQVHATDEDKGVNGQVKYSIVQQPNQKGTKFTVDEETGEVSTNKVRIRLDVFPHSLVIKIQYTAIV